jgi:hypothetical protein
MVIQTSWSQSIRHGCVINGNLVNALAAAIHVFDVARCCGRSINDQRCQKQSGISASCLQRLIAVECCAVKPNSLFPKANYDRILADKNRNRCPAIQ